MQIICHYAKVIVCLKDMGQIRYIESVVVILFGTNPTPSLSCLALSNSSNQLKLLGSVLKPEVVVDVQRNAEATMLHKK